MVKTTKPKLGIYSLCGCNGCQQSFFHMKELFESLIDKFDITFAPLMKGENSNDRLDICLVEGLVASEADSEKLDELREKSKVLVSLGTCACYGNMPLIPGIKEIQESQDQKSSQKTVKFHPIALDSQVKINLKIPGCPPSTEEIVEKLDQYLIEKQFSIFKHPVCFYCSQKDTGCLLLEKKECLGPVINGNCKSICPSFNISCTGCRGPAYDIHLRPLIDIMIKNGLDNDLMIKRLLKYAPKEFNEMLKKEVKG